MTLVAFSGTCFNCKRWGHWANKCPEKKKSDDSKTSDDGSYKKCFTGKCSNCGKEDHKAEGCWEKEENKHKWPKGCKTKSECGAAVIDGADSKVEFLLMGMTFSMQQDLLNDPNVWIGDTGVTLHMTPYADGLTNMQEAKSTDSVTMGNKSVEQAAIIGDLKGMICDKEGNELGKTTAHDIAHVPTCRYNLFSITSLLKEGWALAGSKDCLTLTKEDQKILFDICIPTSKGLIFAMYIRRDTELAGVSTDGKTKMSVAQAHNMHNRLGHCGDDIMKKMAKHLGWELMGSSTPCEACVAAKAKQKNVPKTKDKEVTDYC